MNNSGSNPNKFPRYSGEADPDLEVIDVHTNYRSWSQRMLNGILRRITTAVLRRRFARFGRGSRIDPPCWIRGGESISVGSLVQIWHSVRLDVVNAKPGRISIEIGDAVVLNPSTRISAARSVRIGTGVGISSNCFITDNDHYSADPTIGAVANTHVISSPTSIGAYSWIGEKVCVLKGVSIGKHSIIGAGSVVVHDVPDFSIAVGVPAKVIKVWCHATHQWIPAK